MKTSKQLIEERSTFTAKIAELSAKETLTDAEKTELRSAIDKEETLSSEIETALKLEKRAADIAAEEARKLAGGSLGNNERNEKRSFSFAKVVNHLVNQTPLDGIEKELVQDSQTEARAKGLPVQGIYLDNELMNIVNEKRAMSVGTATEGGNTIATDKQWSFDALYSKRVLGELGVQFLPNLSNNTDLTGFGSGATSVWGTETASISDGSPATASRPLTPKRLGTYVPMSKQLLIQNPQLESRVIQTMMNSIYATVEAAFINGSGSAPVGLLSTSGIQSVAMGTNGGTPTLAKIMELVSALGTANATIENLKFLINPPTMGILKRTPIDSGSGAMIMSYQQYFTGQPNVIDGRPTSVTSNVPRNLTKGSSSGICSALICGEFDKATLAQFGGMDLTVDPYTLALTGQVRLIANTYWDTAFQIPAVFGVIPDVLTA